MYSSVNMVNSSFLDTPDNFINGGIENMENENSLKWDPVNSSFSHSSGLFTNLGDL
jgi:hypothetical protein